MIAAMLLAFLLALVAFMLSRRDSATDRPQVDDFPSLPFPRPRFGARGGARGPIPDFVRRAGR